MAKSKSMRVRFPFDRLPVATCGCSLTRLISQLCLGAVLEHLAHCSIPRSAGRRIIVAERHHSRGDRSRIQQLLHLGSGLVRVHGRIEVFHRVLDSTDTHPHIPCCPRWHPTATSPRTHVGRTTVQLRMTGTAVKSEHRRATACVG